MVRLTNFYYARWPDSHQEHVWVNPDHVQLVQTQRQPQLLTHEGATLFPAEDATAIMFGPEISVLVRESPEQVAVLFEKWRKK